MAEFRLTATEGGALAPNVASGGRQDKSWYSARSGMSGARASGRPPRGRLSEKMSRGSVESRFRDLMQDELEEFELPANSYSNALVCLIYSVKFHQSLPVSYYITTPLSKELLDAYEEVQDSVIKLHGYKHLQRAMKHMLCEDLVFSNPEFLAVVLLIWTMFIVRDVKDTILPVRRIFLSPTTTYPVGIIGGRLEGASMSVKWSIMLLIYLPKLIISFFLWYIGVLFLSTSEGFTDMVINAVALNMVLDLDELLHDALLTDAEKFHISCCALKEPLSMDAGKVVLPWNSVILLSLSVFVVYTYIFHVQQLIPTSFFDGAAQKECSDFLWDVQQRLGNF
eukprot:GEMP01052038.1.p1 GENE.GEMP01052038.1~~GEMP01052038.1.p1  ORF type:complete len:338 (+),score=49.12 GEMP01052038.1:114-1127(+)